MATMELYIWGAAYGLASIDAQCLTVISYLSSVSAEYTLIECNDPGMSPTGELPMLHDGKNWIAGTGRIISYLAKTQEGYDADSDLSPADKGRSVAYSALLDNTLQDAILYSWFVDDINFLDSTRKEYQNLMAFPTKFLLPMQMRKAAIQRVKSYGLPGKVIQEIKTEAGGITIDEELPTTTSSSSSESSTKASTSSITAENTTIYDRAREVYKVLDRKLGDQEFFFGNKQSSLDSKVFGYLAIQYYPDLPNPRFKMILETQYPRLVKFCDRWRTEMLANLPDPSMASEESPFFTHLFSMGGPRSWFQGLMNQPPTGNSKTTVETAKEKEAKKTDAERDFELKRVYAIVGGIVAMVAYVIVNGIIVIGSEEEEEEEEYYQGGGGAYGLTEALAQLSTPEEAGEEDDE